VEYLVNVATGANYPSANVSDFKEASVLVPPDGLLKEFHALTKPIYELRNKLKQKNEALANIRDLLLPRLI
jgi:type I restriction enzyme S subunit